VKQSKTDKAKIDTAQIKEDAGIDELGRFTERMEKRMVIILRAAMRLGKLPAVRDASAELVAEGEVIKKDAANAVLHAIKKKGYVDFSGVVTHEGKEFVEIYEFTGSLGDGKKNT